MTYNKEKVKVLSPKEWYDIIAKEYKKFHKELNTWDNWIFMRFIPRDLNWLRLIDFWAWDWRLSKFFQWKWLSKYLACDISEKMLDKWNNWYDKIVFDLNDVFPLDDNAFDIWLCFFVLLHLNDLNLFFKEAFRIIAPWWRLILLHHKERRSKQFESYLDKFKIQTFVHRYENIESIAEKNFFNVDYTDLDQGWYNIWRLYCFTK